MIVFLSKIIPLLTIISFLFVQIQGANASMHQHENIPASGASQHKSHTMHGMYGLYPMQREASGTSWQPESTPMDGIHIPFHEGMLMLHGFATGVYDKQGGKRGDDGFYGASMFMFAAQKDINKKSTFAVRTMFSLDPATISENGYPLLLQTGETSGDGQRPLIDHQHPHTFFMELAAVYSTFFSKKWSLFFYGGIPAEPALGPPIFVHRFSGTYFPDAPISHHWLDSTHIANGVATIGIIMKNCKLEGSIFTGREPDQHRWTINKPRFDSFSVRFTINPTKNLSAQISSGWLRSPEQLEPKVNIQRITASVSYNQSLLHQQCNWQTTGCWGRNVNKPGKTLDAFLLESTIRLWSHIVFGRFERVAKDELFTENQPLHGKKFNVNKMSMGYIYEVTRWGSTSWSAGIEGSVALLPQQLDQFYSNTPFSCMIFIRVSLG